MPPSCTPVSSVPGSVYSICITRSATGAAPKRSMLAWRSTMPRQACGGWHAPNNDAGSREGGGEAGACRSFTRSRRRPVRAPNRPSAAAVLVGWQLADWRRMGFGDQVRRLPHHRGRRWRRGPNLSCFSSATPNITAQQFAGTCLAGITGALVHMDTFDGTVMEPRRHRRGTATASRWNRGAAERHRLTRDALGSWSQDASVWQLVMEAVWRPTC